MQPQAIFRLVFRTSGWFRDHLTRSGIALLLITAFAGAIGLNTEVNLAHQVFALGISLIAVDAISAQFVRRQLPPLSASRRLPPVMTFGASANYSINLVNEGKVALQSVLLQEVLLQPWTDKSLFVSAKGGTYRTYLALLRRMRVLDVPPVSISAVLPDSALHVSMHAVPTARGQAMFSNLYVVVSGYLGLVQSRKVLNVSVASQIVLPRQIPFDLQPPQGRRTLQVGGIPLANHVGDSEEFRSLRDYRPGDPLRSIHWRSFARTGKPLVREYQQEYFSRHALVLDTACLAHQRDTFEASVSIAAWIASRPLEADSLLDLMFVGDRVHRLSLGRSLGHVDTFLRVLATVTPTSIEGMSALMLSLSQNAKQITSAVIILQSWDDIRQKAISDLIAHGLQPTVLVIGQAQADTSGVNSDVNSKWRGILHFVPLPTATAIGVPS